MSKIHRLIIAALLIPIISFIAGCSGSDEPEMTDAELRKQDSISVYMALENSRIKYTSALQHNEQSDSRSSIADFESAVTQLLKVDKKLLDKYQAWNKDYKELSTSVVQDYLTVVPDVKEMSEVFQLAKQVNVTFKKEEKKTYSNSFNPNDLPKGNEIKLERNQFVDDYINYFQTSGRKYMDKWLYRAGKYFNLMRSILRQNGAPEELIYLAMIESGLDPAISSWAGAIGMWQFMPTTGSAYGLYYDSYTDDKRDVEKATDAAARHLLDLKRSLGDWYLALASYNAGPGRITSAMSKTGSSDFWVIRDYLPKETRNYVPQFIACALITQNPSAYGFNDVEWGRPIEYERVIIKSELSMSRIADLAETDVDKIRELNSQMLSDVTPLFPDGYLIKIPKGSYETFKRNYNNASDFEKYSFAPIFDGDEGTSTVVTETIGKGYLVNGYNVEDTKYIISTRNRELVIHKLGDNEELYSVALKYGVRPTDIRIWNNLNYGRMPKKGDNVSIWLTPKKYKELFGVYEEIKSVKDTTTYQGTNLDSNTNDVINISQHTRDDNENVLVNRENRTNNPTYKREEVKKKEEVKKNEDVVITKKEEKKEVVVKKKEAPKKNTPKGITAQIYTVKKGDNLAAIAANYNVSISEIREWNDMDDDIIKVGQKLKIYSETKKETVTKKSKTYTVKAGDNLNGIASSNGVSVSDLKKWNDLKSDVIKEGQVLKLYGSNEKITEKKTNEKKTTKKTKYHTVKKGETIAAIANKYDVSVADIKKWNSIKKDNIKVGQKLIVSK